METLDVELIWQASCYLDGSSETRLPLKREARGFASSPLSGVALSEHCICTTLHLLCIMEVLPEARIHHMAYLLNPYRLERA
jgi:hypothetical protein